MTIEKIECKLGGIICGKRCTSCADKLAKAVREYCEKTKQPV